MLSLYYVYGHLSNIKNKTSKYVIFYTVVGATKYRYRLSCYRPSNCDQSAVSVLDHIKKDLVLYPARVDVPTGIAE